MSKRENSNKNGEMSMEKYQDDFEITKYHVTGRKILKVLCCCCMLLFFCPMFLVSCGSQEIMEVSGMEAAKGIEYMGETVDASPLMFLLLILPLVALVCLFMNSKREYHGRVSAIAGGASGLILICSYMLTKSGMKEEEPLLEVETLFAYHAYIWAAVFIVLLGLYLEYRYRKNN